MPRKRGPSGTIPPLAPYDVGPEAPLIQMISKTIGDIQPRDVASVEIVGDDFERFERPVPLQSETAHRRLLPPRKILISETEVSVIRSAFPRWIPPNTPIPAWIRDSVITMEREFIEFEILRASGTHTQTDSASAICSLRDPNGPLAHQVVPIRNPHSSSR